MSSAVGRRRFVVLLSIVLFVFGLVMVTSASSSTSVLNGGSQWGYLEKQLGYGLIGLAAMWCTMRVPIALVRRFAAPALVVSTVLLFLVFVPGLNYTANGATRWLAVGPLQLQPSELVKVAVIVWMADVLARTRAPQHWLWGFLLRREGHWSAPLSYLTPGGKALGLAAVIFLQHDLGTAMVTGGTVLALFALAGTSLGVMLRTVVPATALVLVSIALEPYRRERFFAFLDPAAHAHDSGYQLMQGLIAIGSGGPMGRGLGHSVEKIFYLPEAHTDMIFSVIGEELGLVGIALVLISFFALAVVGFRIADRAPTRFTSLLAAGLTAAICGQAVLNIAGVVGVLPLTGVPLPLVSYGGTSLIVTFASLGLLANIAVCGHDRDARRAARGDGDALDEPGSEPDRADEPVAPRAGRRRRDDGAPGPGPGGGAQPA